MHPFSKKTIAALLIALPATLPVHTAMADDAAFVTLQSLTAFGIRSAWRATVDNGKLSMEGKTIASETIDIRKTTHDGVVDFIGRKQDTSISLRIYVRPCRDRLGPRSTLTAILTYGKKRMKGCAVAGAFEHAPT